MYFPESMVAAAADRAACRDLLRNGSRTFFAASHLLPARVRDPATALYAFCRLADDAVDEGAPGEHETGEHETGECATCECGTGRGATLRRLQLRLDRAYRGEPMALPADRLFAGTVHRFAIPRALPAALLEGLAWDAEGRRYETLADLHAYAARVAGAVGVMMAIVMGVRDHAALARACDLGAAMQFTNIARDIGEDARNGRLYLPLSWMREAGLDPDAWLAAPRFEPAIGAMVERLLGEADRLYRSSERGIADLPLDCRPGIRAARHLYAAIGHEVARRNHDSVSGRAFVPLRGKLLLLGRSLVPARRRGGSLAQAPIIAEARFLVEAVAGVEARRPQKLGEQVLWVLDLFERIERRRQPEAGL